MSKTTQKSPLRTLHAVSAIPDVQIYVHHGEKITVNVLQIGAIVGDVWTEWDGLDLNSQLARGSRITIGNQDWRVRETPDEIKAMIEEAAASSG